MGPQTHHQVVLGGPITGHPVSHFILSTWNFILQCPTIFAFYRWTMPAGGAGFEPTPPGSKPGILPLDDPPVIAGEPGFEPGIAGPEPAVLPLHHSPILGENERAPDSLTGSASRA